MRTWSRQPLPQVETSAYKARFRFVALPTARSFSSPTARLTMVCSEPRYFMYFDPAKRDRFGSTTSRVLPFRGRHPADVTFDTVRAVK
jgi:hypothetical protein